jgi:hypothetical protein
MEIHVTPEELKVIEGLAAQNGTSPEEQARKLFADGVRRAADYDRWFREKVREGMNAANRGELVDHEEFGRMLHQRYPG